MNSILSYFEKAFTLDLRSLAVMRMGYGLIILVDLIVRSQSFTEHYTEQGAFPLAALFTLGMRPDQFSLHAMSGSRDFEVLLFVLHGLFAVGLFLGWRTRLMTVLCYLMAVSLQNRNFLILNGGDNWMRIVLFWAIFLPWGDRFSIDSLKSEPESPNQLFSVAGCGLILQVMAVYFVSALYKTGPAWRTEGSAAYLSLKQLEWNSDLGLYLLYFPKFLVYCSFAVFLFEMVGPWMLVSPAWSQPLRLFAVSGFFVFHAALEFSMELGMFPYIGMVTVLGLLPALPWESKWGRRFQERLEQLFRQAPWSQRLLTTAGSSRPLTAPFSSWALSLVVAVIIYWNAAGRDAVWFPAPEPITSAVYLSGINQYWGLFAPEPGRRGGWFVFEGLLSDGSRVDAANGGPLNWAEPSSSSIYYTQRIKRWIVGTSVPEYKAVLPYFARYIIQEYDRNHPLQDAKLVRLRAHYLSRESLLNFEDPGLPQDHVYMDFTREQLGLP